MFLLDYLQHRRDWQVPSFFRTHQPKLTLASRFKQSERAARVASLTAYHGPLTPSDKQTLLAPIESLVAAVHAGTTTPLSIRTSSLIHSYPFSTKTVPQSTPTANSPSKPTPAQTASPKSSSPLLNLGLPPPRIMVASTSRAR